MRHAYLIIAHNGESELRNLISSLDDGRNDIYVMLDKKWKTVNIQKLYEAVIFSRIFFVRRISVSWGGSSQILAEMILFKESYQHGEYRYYHLLSGVDLPVKSQNYIHDFFRKNDGLNFIKVFDSEPNQSIAIRYEQYHLLQDKFIGKKRNFFKYVDFASCYVQKFLGVRRFKDQFLIRSHNWMSVTDELVGFLVKNFDEIIRKYRWTYCCDELFVLSEIWTTQLKNTLSPLGDLRFMEWVWYSRRDFSPKVLTVDDYQKLIDPNILFARKLVYPRSIELVRLLSEKTLAEFDNRD